MMIKMRTEPTSDEEDKIHYVFLRTGEDPCTLIQIDYLASNYNTVQDMMQTLADVYDDPHKGYI